jgi:hypothetical protein
MPIVAHGRHVRMKRHVQADALTCATIVDGDAPYGAASTAAPVAAPAAPR